MKGLPRRAITRAVTQAYKDVIFLFFLHLEVNRRLLLENRYYWSRWQLLVQELRFLIDAQTAVRQINWDRIRFEMELPFPLDLETVEAVKAANDHHVITWEVLEDSDELGQWLRDNFVLAGKTALPGGAYSAYSMKVGPTDSYIRVPSEDEVRELFQDAESFKLFLDGEDFSYGLADVPDADYESSYVAMVEAVQNVGHTGMVVDLHDVPTLFLSEAPLIDGYWIDRYTVELAEWGARIKEKGYQFDDTKDNHPLAWYRITDLITGSVIDESESTKIWIQTRKHLARFPGETNEIDRRVYLSFNDYMKWRGRHVKGDLGAGMQSGISVAQWNHWIEEIGGEGVAAAAGLKVSKLSCPVDSDQYGICRTDKKLKEEMDRREFFLNSLKIEERDHQGDGQSRQELERWKELASGILPEIYTLRKAIDSIDKRYFDGHQALVAPLAEKFNQ